MDVCLYVCYRRLNRSSDRDETLGDVREHAWEGFRVIKILPNNKGGPRGVNIDFLNMSFIQRYKTQIFIIS